MLFATEMRSNSGNRYSLSTIRKNARTKTLLIKSWAAQCPARDTSFQRSTTSTWPSMKQRMQFGWPKTKCTRTTTSGPSSKPTTKSPSKPPALTNSSAPSPTAQSSVIAIRPPHGKSSSQLDTRGALPCLVRHIKST